MIFDYTLTPITLQQIQIFLCAARIQNFTHAAAELNMTQPGVSKSIATLESILGFSLFEKSGRHVTLTKEGIDHGRYP